VPKLTLNPSAGLGLGPSVQQVLSLRLALNRIVKELTDAPPVKSLMM
jgi:hypothetical protein